MRLQGGNAGAEQLDGLGFPGDIEETAGTLSGESSVAMRFATQVVSGAAPLSAELAARGLTV